MLTTLLTTTPNGAMWADARARGISAIPCGDAMRAAAKRPQATVFGGSDGTHVFNGTHVSNGTTKLRPEGLGGGTG